MKIKLSLQTLILGVTLLIALIVMLVSYSLLTYISAHALEKEIASYTSMAAHRLASDLRPATPATLQHRFHESMDEIMELVPNIIRTDVYAQFGNTLTAIASSSLPNVRNLEDFELAALASGKSDTYLIEEEGSNRRYVAVYPFRILNGKPAFVTVVSSLKSVKDLIQVHSRMRWFTLLAAAILMALGITLLFRTTVYRSMRHLVNTMNHFQAGNQHVRAQERLPGEFGELAQHLNAMLQVISEFQSSLRSEIATATVVLANRNQELEMLNLQLVETQKRLMQAERLALVGQLTATFAHEIGSPLNALSLHLQVLQEDASLTPAQRERVKLAQTEINRVVSIVESLLANARLPTTGAPVELGELLRRVIRLLSPVVQARQVQVQLSGAETPLQTFGNSDQLQQLFLNLLNNALDALAHQTGGQVNIRLERVGSPERQCLVEVCDSGTGISPEKLDRIFEPFFTTKEFGKGTGLGLAVSWEIIRSHSGRIEAENTAGQGACFRVYLPWFELADYKPGPSLGPQEGPRT